MYDTNLSIVVVVEEIKKSGILNLFEIYNSLSAEIKKKMKRKYNNKSSSSSLFACNLDKTWHFGVFFFSLSQIYLISYNIKSKKFTKKKVQIFS